MRQTIRSVGVLSCAKITAALYGAIGLLIFPFIIIGALVGTFAGDKTSALSGALGVVMALVLPILYAGIGFVGGAISALLYNLIASRVGGIELEFQPAPVAPVVASI
jgi:hypothetical protein